MALINPYLKQYQKNQVETASPEQILILLYDGAIQFLNKAKLSLENKDYAELYNNIVGCQNIILEFMNTLDMDIGGELAVNLHRLYDYLYNALSTANINKDMKKIEEVLRHLKSLRETWQKAIVIANTEKKQQEESGDYDDEESSENEGWGA